MGRFVGQAIDSLGRPGSIQSQLSTSKSPYPPLLPVLHYCLRSRNSYSSPTLPLRSHPHLHRRWYRPSCVDEAGNTLLLPPDFVRQRLDDSGLDCYYDYVHPDSSPNHPRSSRLNLDPCRSLDRGRGRGYMCRAFGDTPSTSLPSSPLFLLFARPKTSFGVKRYPYYPVSRPFLYSASLSELRAGINSGRVLTRSCRLVRISRWERGAREVLGCGYGLVRRGTKEA
jgi:hypothetical protein